MRGGQLSDFITFEKRVITTNPFSETWELDFDGPIPADPQRAAETVARFTIRYRTQTNGEEINAKSHRILWDGAIWHITSATHDRKRTMLFLDCDFSMLLEV